MNNVNIIYYISKFLDLLFRKYWLILTFLDFLSSCEEYCLQLLIQFLIKKQRGLNAKLALEECI